MGVDSVRRTSDSETDAVARQRLGRRGRLDRSGEQPTPPMRIRTITHAAHAAAPSPTHAAASSGPGPDGPGHAEICTPRGVDLDVEVLVGHTAPAYRGTAVATAAGLDGIGWPQGPGGNRIGMVGQPQHPASR
jgi:hypothetical protein